MAGRVLQSFTNYPLQRESSLDSPSPIDSLSDETLAKILTYVLDGDETGKELTTLRIVNKRFNRVVNDFKSIQAENDDQRSLLSEKQIKVLKFIRSHFEGFLYFKYSLRAELISNFVSILILNKNFDIAIEFFNKIKDPTLKASLQIKFCKEIKFCKAFPAIAEEFTIESIKKTIEEIENPAFKANEQIKFCRDFPAIAEEYRDFTKNLIEKIEVPKFKPIIQIWFCKVFHTDEYIASIKEMIEKREDISSIELQLEFSEAFPTVENIEYTKKMIEEIEDPTMKASLQIKFCKAFPAIADEFIESINKTIEEIENPYDKAVVLVEFCEAFPKIAEEYKESTKNIIEKIEEPKDKAYAQIRFCKVFHTDIYFASIKNLIEKIEEPRDRAYLQIKLCEAFPAIVEESIALIIKLIKEIEDPFYKAQTEAHFIALLIVNFRSFI